MKKSISFLLCLVLIFSSFTFAFASPTSWDTTDQANLRAIKNLLDSGGGIYNMISTISSTTNTISNNINTIKGYLVDSGHGVAYWVQAISTWMSPIYNALISTPTDLSTIIGALGYTENSTYHPYLNEINSSLSRYNGTYDLEGWQNHAHLYLNSNINSPNTGSWYSFGGLNSDNTLSTYNTQWKQGTPIGNIAYILTKFNNNFCNGMAYLSAQLLPGATANQNVVNWGSLSTSTFTPSSGIDGIYKYLSSIQAPLARLSYVLANDQEIEARDYASANQQAVVDNFIDPSGDASASTSDFSNIADFSSGYQSTFSSDASPTGIFNLFTSDNMSWFSQETYNQLDTTNNNRAKSDNTFNTPLLDQQINSIYEQLGVKQP